MIVLQEALTLSGLEFLVDDLSAQSCVQKAIFPSQKRLYALDLVELPQVVKVRAFLDAS